MYLLADSARCFLNFPHMAGVIRTVRNEDYGNQLDSRNKRAQQAKSLPSISVVNKFTPVMLPPGRLRLVTMPRWTGSVPLVKIIGIVEVAALAAMLRNPITGNGVCCARAASVGRIYKAVSHAPREAPWFWGLEFHEWHGSDGPQYGNVASLEAVKQAFRAAWDRIPAHKKRDR